MFERNELYRVYKISIPIIDLLVPYWNLYINIKGLSLIDTLEFPAGYESYKNNCIDIYNDYQHYQYQGPANPNLKYLNPLV